MGSKNWPRLIFGRTWDIPTESRTTVWSTSEIWTRRQCGSTCQHPRLSIPLEPKLFFWKQLVMRRLVSQSYWRALQMEPNLNRWSSSSEKTMPKDNFPAGVVVHNHPKGWMDESGVKIWIEKVWRARPGGFANTQSLLVWDSFSAHLTGYRKTTTPWEQDCDRSYTQWPDKPRPTSGCLFKQAIQGLFTGKMDDLDDEWGKDIHTGWPAPSSISCNSLSMG